MRPPLYLTFSEGSRRGPGSTDPPNETSNWSHDHPTFKNICCGGAPGLNLPLNRHTDISLYLYNLLYYLNCEFWETMWLSHDRNAASPRPKEKVHADDGCWGCTLWFHVEVLLREALFTSVGKSKTDVPSVRKFVRKCGFFVIFTKRIWGVDTCRLAVRVWNTDFGSFEKKCQSYDLKGKLTMFWTEFERFFGTFF